MLEAKQAILDEHHRRFQTLHQEGRWVEAIHQIPVTLSCAADLLNESLLVLDEAIKMQKQILATGSPPPPTKTP